MPVMDGIRVLGLLCTILFHVYVPMALMPTLNLNHVQQVGHVITRRVRDVFWGDAAIQFSIFYLAVFESLTTLDGKRWWEGIVRYL